MFTKLAIRTLRHHLQPLQLSPLEPDDHLHPRHHHRRAASLQKSPCPPKQQTQILRCKLAIKISLRTSLMILYQLMTTTQLHRKCEKQRVKKRSKSRLEISLYCHHDHLILLLLYVNKLAVAAAAPRLEHQFEDMRIEHEVNGILFRD